MEKIIEFIKKVFWYFIVINIKKEKIEYWEFNDSSIKEIEKIWRNIIAELYLQWETTSAKIVWKELSKIVINYNSKKKN